MNKEIFFKYKIAISYFEPLHLLRSTFHSKKISLNLRKFSLKSKEIFFEYRIDISYFEPPHPMRSTFHLKKISLISKKISLYLRKFSLRSKEIFLYSSSHLRTERNLSVLLKINFFCMIWTVGGHEYQS